LREEKKNAKKFFPVKKKGKKGEKHRRAGGRNLGGNVDTVRTKKRTRGGGEHPCAKTVTEKTKKTRKGGHDWRRNSAEKTSARGGLKDEEKRGRAQRPKRKRLREVY